MTLLDDSCFEGCAGLKEVYFENHFLEIGRDAFKDCAQLSNDSKECILNIKRDFIEKAQKDGKDIDPDDYLTEEERLKIYGDDADDADDELPEDFPF